MKISVAALAVLSAALVLPACGGTSSTPGGSGGRGGAPAVKKVVQGLAMQISNQVVAIGETAQITVVATYQDGTTGEITEDLGWQSSDANIVTVNSGLVTPVATGLAAISVTHGDHRAELGVTITAQKEVLVALLLKPNAPTIERTRPVQFTATGVFGSGVQLDVTNSVAWASSATDFLTVSASGLASAVAPGQATITASLQGVTGQTAATTKEPAAIQSVTINPANPQVRMGTPVQLTAIGNYDDNTQRDVSAQVVWTSSNPAVLTISATGLATAVSEGTASVTADFEGMLATTNAIATPSCAYPRAGGSIAMGSAMPNMSWTGVYNADGTTRDFSMEAFACSAEFANYDSVHFIVGAGWCPNCPAYTRRVDSMKSQIEANGGVIVYVSIETRSRQPSHHRDSHDIIMREIGNSSGMRIGDADTMPTAMTFSRAVRAVPGAFVVQKSDMQVIADQGRSQYQLDFVGLARQARGQ